MFSCEAEEVDEDKGRDSDEEKRSAARCHSLLHREGQEGRGFWMAGKRSYTDIWGSRVDVDVDVDVDADADAIYKSRMPPDAGQYLRIGKTTDYSPPTVANPRRPGFTDGLMTSAKPFLGSLIFK